MHSAIHRKLMNISGHAANAVIRMKQLKCFDSHIYDFLAVDLERPIPEAKSDVQVVYKYKTQPYMSNLDTNTHGGFTTTLCDICTNLTATAYDRNHRLNPMTMDITAAYHKPVELETDIRVLTEVEKGSKRFCSMRFEVLNLDGAILVSGRVLKFFSDQKL